MAELRASLVLAGRLRGFVSYLKKWQYFDSNLGLLGEKLLLWPTRASMKNQVSLSALVMAFAVLICGCPESTSPNDAGPPLPPEPQVDSSLAFANILDLEGVPAQTEDWSVFSMSDLGSW